jgi:cell wall-associated NlpC family hydrolase
MDTEEGDDQDPLSLHKYSYAEGNPVGNLDPSGNDVGDTLDSMAMLQVTTILGSGSGSDSGAPDIHKLISDKAHSYHNSTRWEEWRGSPLNCNIYVADVLQEVGQSVPTYTRQPGTIRLLLMKVGLAELAQTPPLAQEWGDTSFSLPNWRVLDGGPDAAKPGDVIAQKNANGGGHVGIVVGNQLTSSASSIAKPAGLIVENDWGFRMPKQPGVWREGLKQNCIVRRFTGDPNHPESD